MTNAKRTAKKRSDNITAALERLAEAQSRTDEAIERLTEAQKRTEERVEALALAQARTEERLGRLEGVIERLAEAQQRTEETVKELATAVGRLSDTIGYGLEDVARVMLPGYLERHFGLHLEDLERRVVGPEGQEVEIDLYGEGRRDGDQVVVLGEAKSRIYGRDVEEFDRTLRPVVVGIKEKVIKVMVGYLIHPSASPLASEKEILLVASYQR